MPHWNTRGLRGSTLEEMINLTNDIYRAKELAVIHKIPTPITPVTIDKSSRNITLAYFGQKSTVDYIGVVQGLPVAFDAKETNAKNLPVQNIHAHQIEFMRDFEKQEGLAFLIVHFRLYNEFYLLPFATLHRFWGEAQNGGRKSIPYEAFDKNLLITSKGGYLVHYLEGVLKIQCLSLNA